MNAQDMKSDARIRKRLWDFRGTLITYVVMLFISGIHVGLIVLLTHTQRSEALSAIIMLLFWAVMAGIFTLVTVTQIRHTYEEPMQTLGHATKAVAGGDFSVRLKPRHAEDRLDYIDVMYLDFNKMAEELGSIETMKTDFFSNVSHEMKTPLAVILNSLELMKSGALSQEEQRLQMDTAIFATRRMADMIGNLLKLNKLEKQTIVPTMETYELCDELARCALNFEAQWESKNIDFEADIEDSCYITADEDLMDMVWNNLFSNAVKFTEPGGQVTLHQKAMDGVVTVSVEDTGCGMSEDTMRHIFDKFYQGDTSHSTEGNGLGLALTKRILQLMNASVSVESVPGRGSVFTVTLKEAQKPETAKRSGIQQV